MTALLEAALLYAQAGLPSFPCKGKRPLTPNGFKDASLVPEVLTAWFSAPEPDTTIAIAIPDWLCILDIDGEKGKQALKENGYTPPATCTVRTPHGKHYWYIWQGERAPTRKIRFLPEVDLLANGYVLAPPSAGYAWTEPFNKDEIEIAPDWLAVAFSEEIHSRQQAIDVDAFFDGLPEGQRQAGLFRYACRLRGIPRITKTEAKALVHTLAVKSEGKGYRKFPDTDALVERVWRTYDAAEGVDTKEEGERVWSLADLLAETIDPPNYLIDRLLPGIGYTLFFAAQGAGKSVFADQAAACIATGRSFMGRSVRQSGVLVLDVEQEANGAADRWRKLFRGLGIDRPPANLYTAFSWPILNDGGFDKLSEFLVEHPHVQLVVVDTLAQAMDMGESGGGNAYFNDSKIMSRFTRFAKEYGIAFLVVSHSRKSQGQDTFSDMASGSRGITGPAKARWGLLTDEETGTGKLMVGGKLPSCTLTMTFDRELLLWR